MTRAWLVLFLGFAACATPSPTVDHSDRGTLHSHADLSQLVEYDDLRRRLRLSVYSYFRFVNVGFSDRTCQRFVDLIPSVPTVNLHGDAHVEQYAVTQNYFGLADFDDASWGPSVLDLVRFGVSLNLAGISERVGKRIASDLRVFGWISRSVDRAGTRA